MNKNFLLSISKTTYIAITLILIQSNGVAMASPAAPQKSQQAALVRLVVIDDRAPFSSPVPPIATSSGFFGGNYSTTQAAIFARQIAWINRETSNAVYIHKLKSENIQLRIIIKYLNKVNSEQIEPLNE